MVLYDLECPVCGMDTDFAPMGGPFPTCPKCGRARNRVFSVPITIIPAWMRDENLAGRARHREWLKSDEAKKMDLTLVKGE